MIRLLFLLTSLFLAPSFALGSPHYYFIGAGIGGLNTALLLIQQGISGHDITILEANQAPGGIFYREVSEDGRSFFAHTVRTFDEPSYTYTQQAWRQAGIWNSQHLMPRNFSQPRETIPKHMRKAFFSIWQKSDRELENLSIKDLLSPELIASPTFRYFFHLTGLFEHHSALALKRYMTHTHAKSPHNWVLRSTSCDYESIVEPIVDYLTQQGVKIEYKNSITQLHVANQHVTGIDDLRLDPEDKVIATVGANVGSNLFPQNVLISEAQTATPPSTPLETSTRQPHSSVWLLAQKDLASQIEALFPDLETRDFIHIDVDHPWQITLISLGETYYKKQPKDHRLFYIAMNDLSKPGLSVNCVGTQCTEKELAEEVLKRLNFWNILQTAPDQYTATVDSRARQLGQQDSAPIVRFMPGESEKVLVFPDTHCDNLAVIGERVRAYKAPVPTTEWVTETGYRAIQYLLTGERYRMTDAALIKQEKKYTRKFVWDWIKHKIGFGSNFTSSVKRSD